MTYKIKESGLLFYMFRTYGGYHRSDINTVCDIPTAFLKSVAIILFFIMIAVTASLGLFGWVVPLIALGGDTSLFDEGAEQSFVLFITLSTTFTIWFLYAWITHNTKSVRQTVSESLPALWLAGKRDKYCARVEVVRDDDA